MHTPKKVQRILSSGQTLYSGLVEQILRDSAAKSEARNPNGYTFFLHLFDEHLEQVLVRNRLLDVILAGRDATSCLLS